MLLKTMFRCKECGYARGHTFVCSQGPINQNHGTEKIPEYIPPFFNKNGFLRVDLNPVYIERTRRDLAKLFVEVALERQIKRLEKLIPAEEL